jgi:glycosyltransferase involved in cell wall biosynthesis
MLAIFESHPIQYRAPVYKELQRLVPGRFHVFYGTDASLRGGRDQDFGKNLAWDEPLLEGYPNTILKQERGEPLKGFGSLHGRGLSHVFDTYRPKAVLQTQFFYEYDFVVFFQALIRGIPIWIRQETQDEANKRSPGKNFLRSMVYRAFYKLIQKGFYIGELNREHLLRHGLPSNRLIRSPYCTPDRFENMPEAQYAQIRETCRNRFGIGRDKIVVGFFGKFIPKKNPEILTEAIPFLKEELKRAITLLFVGSGALETEIKAAARSLEQSGVQTVFAGFVNQSAIRDFYAATDIMVLPSRFAGETWGLVVNEALQAGCAVVVSEAVGCAREFSKWERVRTMPVGDAKALARAIEELAAFPSEFRWAREPMKAYSTFAAASALAKEIELELNHA